MKMSFREVIHDRWFEFCQNSSRHGLMTYRNYRQSGLSGGPLLSFRKLLWLCIEMCTEKMKSEILVSVVVCTYNRADLLTGCLDSLKSQTLSESSYEVIVIDNNSGDQTQEVAKKFVAQIANLRIILEEKQGLSHARNRGWQESTGQYVAYLDDDAKAAPDWCEKILAAFQEKWPDTAAVGGKILPWYLKMPPEWFSDVLETRSWGDVPGFLSPEQARYGFSGSNMAFRRDVLSEYNGFNPSFGMIGNKMRFAEETELFYRLSADSHRLWYDPEILVYHLVTDADMKCAYRFLRGYRAGTAMIHLEQRRVFSRLYMFNLRKLVITLVDFPILSKPGMFWRSRYALWLGRLGSTLGYLSGQRR